MAHLHEDIKSLIRTRHGIVTVDTLDESFACRSIIEAVDELGLPALEWTVSGGLRKAGSSPTSRGISNTEALAGALQHLRHSDMIGVYIFKDALRHIEDAATERLLREVAQQFGRDSRTLLLIDHGGTVPATVRHLTVPLDMPLPDLDEIRAIVKASFQDVTTHLNVDVKLSKAEYEHFIASLRGLTRMEIGQVVADCLLHDGRFGPDDVSRAIDRKRQKLGQTGVLEYMHPPAEPPKIGGMQALRNWLAKRSKAFTPEAREFGLEHPRGMLMLGVQGCGKSMMARYVAAGWGMPLLRMSVGALYDKYVGESEKHLRQAFQVAEVMAPCVLWIDEIEKAFASSSAGTDADGGLSKRMFGQLLTWMQDHEQPVFIVATANDIQALPPELMRKGRFDEIFFVDLPGPEARRRILDIHLAKRKRDPRAFDLDALTAVCDGFSGAEIEQAVVSALYTAFSDGTDLTNDHLLSELNTTQPLSVTMAEKVAALRNWARDRCVCAD
ncbi:MAG: AAA family ATPase [Planctomycetes bacterium]|nr:AAA family ATPase [Planctomycetota bacterium]